MINQPTLLYQTTQEKKVACGASHETFTVFPDRWVFPRWVFIPFIFW